MNTYSAYKDSGEQWLGQIPAHWEVGRLANYFIEKREKVSDTVFAPLSVTKKGVLPQLENVAKSNDSDNRKGVRKGDFVINSRSDRKGSSGVAEQDGSVSLINIVLEPRKSIVPAYCNYFLKSQNFIEEFYRNGRGIVADLWTTRYSEMKLIKLAIPSVEEQEAMVAYLDEQTAQIDNAIAREQKMIDLLEERKQIIIQQAVTKGLNPNAKMKDSKVIGDYEVPAHWKVTKTLYALSMPITDGPHETPVLYEDGIPFVSAEAVSCGRGSIDFSHIRGYISKSFYDECCKKYIPQINDIYMIKSGATTGRVAIVDTDRVFTIWSPLAVFRCNAEVMFCRYLFYLLQSNFYQKQVQLGWSYGTQQNIGMRALEKLRILLPPLQEQYAIVEYLDEHLVGINRAIDAREKMIALLQERKQIIINEVVTGKIKVL